MGARAFNSATYASTCCSTQAHRTREGMRRPTAPRLRRCQLRRRRVQNGYKRVAAACCNDLRNLHGSPAFMPFLRLVASRRSLSEATRCPTTRSSFLASDSGLRRSRDEVLLVSMTSSVLAACLGLVALDLDAAEEERCHPATGPVSGCPLVVRRGEHQRDLASPLPTMIRSIRTSVGLPALPKS